MSPRVRAPSARWLACCALVLAGHARAELRFEVDDAALSASQRAASARLLTASLARLPPSMRAALDRVDVQWRDDLPRHVAGRAYARSLRLDRHLLSTPSSLAVDDAQMRAALAAVLHEVAHLYDRGAGLSRDPRLLDLAGWQVAPLKLGLRASRDAFTDRTPDRYETASPREFVAVNLEYFLLDPGYACRRPQLAAYFSTRLAWTPAQAACAPGMPFFEADAGAPLLALDPARVYAVDYLLAEGNDHAMSRWGHSMLRLVICAPGRAPGPDCRLDLAEHRVLSFRAFVDDVQVSSWRGLAGAYPSRLFVLPLSQVIAEYTRVQLRGLRSIPLALDRGEIAGLLQRAAQVHWSYDGRYRFVSNNCAVETFKLLHDGVPRLASAGLSTITPNGLLRRLTHAGVADVSVLSDRDRALREGFYFESAAARYQAMFDVARERLGLPQRAVRDWLALDAAERAPSIARADLRAGAALLLLEQAALQQRRQTARDVLKRRLLARGADRDARDAVRAVLAEDAAFARPAALLDGSGYGLPQLDERARLADAATPRLQRQSLARDALIARAQQWLPAREQREMAGIERNLDLLGARLRDLNRAEGGIALPN